MTDSLPARIDTTVSKLFSIRYPVIQGGMIWVSGWKLATAVSNAGGLGLIGAGSMKPKLLAEHIAKAKAACSEPIGVNIPLMREDAEELVRVTLDCGIRIVFTSAGNPAKFTSLLHEAGCVVVHVVPSLKLALKAEGRGVDAIVGEGFEAGGHNGFEEIATFPLIPRLVDHLHVPVIAAGGIWDGRGMAAAFALGAQGVQVGTRFACTIESSASDAYKQAVIASAEPATTLTLRRLSPTRMLRGSFARRAMEAEAVGATHEELQALLGERRAKQGTFLGDLDEGIMEAGEVAGDIRDIPRAGEVLENIVRGFGQTTANLTRYASA